MLMQLLHWRSRLELSGGYAGEQDVGQQMPLPAYSISITGNKLLNNPHKNKNKMKTKHQMLKWLVLLFVLIFSAMGAMAQTNTSTTQSVCIGNESYKVDPSPLPSPTYTWSISGGTSTDWQINGTGTNITVDWKTEGVYILSVFSTSNGCPGPTQSVTVTVTALPTASISYAGDPYCNSVAGAQAVTLTGTGSYTGGTYTASAGGLIIDATTGSITPGTSTPGTYTVTYTIAAAGGCAAVTATISVTITLAPTASISYAGDPYCNSVAGAQAVTLTGTGAYTGGTYTASAGGLIIDASTGSITPGTSTPGTYTVTYSVVSSGGCAAVTATTSVTITLAPTASISYAGDPYCNSVAGAQAVTLTGTGAYTGGTYTASVGGLIIDASTGSINPGTSTPGTYTVTYSVVSSGGCAAVTATTSVTITLAPTASISYAGLPYCGNVSGSQAVTLTGTGAYTGGTFIASAGGLTIDASTGAITPITSTAGTYTVTYTTVTADGCGAVIATVSVTINPIPVTSVIYHN